MLKEFVQAIGEMAVKAKQPELIADPFNPRKAYLVHEGTFVEKNVASPLLNSRVDTLDSLVSAIESFGDESSAWCNRERIEVVLDDVDRLERLHYPLHPSDQMKAVCKLPRQFDQRSLVLFLKRDLCGTIDPVVIAPFRQLDFSKRESAGGTVKHGDESLGRSIQAAVAQATEIPEFLTLSVRVYSNPDIVCRANIILSVDIDVQRGMIGLTPLPDEITNAFLSAEEFVADTLSEKVGDSLVFRGTPTMIGDARRTKAGTE
jgi:hypothetical protein